MSSMIQDAYMWRVVYADGTLTDEFDAARPDGRGWHEREGKPVKDIWLAWTHWEDNAVHHVSLPEGAEPVFVRRRRIVTGPDGTECGRETVHVIGWKQGERGAYLFIFADGSTLLSADFNAV